MITLLNSKLYSLRKNCPYLELFWSVFNPNVGKCGPEKLQTWTLFTQWLRYFLFFLLIALLMWQCKHGIYRSSYDQIFHVKWYIFKLCLSHISIMTLSIHKLRDYNRIRLFWKNCDCTRSNFATKDKKKALQDDLKHQLEESFPIFL